MKKKEDERINHFSIRKLSIGAASVLLSTTLYFGINISNSTVHAAEETTSAQTVKTNPIKEKIAKSVEPVGQTDQSKNNQATVPQQKTASTEKVENQEGKDNEETEQVSTKPSSNVIYAGSDQNVQVNGWFKVEVNSGTLTNIPQGSTYQIAIGQNLPLNYNRLDIDIPKFTVTNNGEGIFDVTADGDYTTASFDIIASMSYTEPISTDKTITLPITITHNGQTTNLDTQVNLTPEPKKTESETHPLIYYKCFGLNPQTNRISWGIYVNYNEEELKDVDISALFNGDQQLIKDSIAVYAPTEDEVSDGINAERYPDDTYNYDLSSQMQEESTPTSVELQQAGPFIVDGKNYSKQPLYIYFQTQLPSGTNVSTGDGLSKYSSVLNLKASGIAVHTPPTSPASSGNGGQADGENVPVAVSETKTINETINYLYQGSNKVAAPQYKAVPITFTRTGEKNVVTGKVTWGQWNADESFKAVTSPSIKGYTANERSIASQSVNPESKDLVFNVYYTKNAPTKVSETRTINETINYLYQGSNKVAAPQYKAVPITFTRTGEKDAVTDKVTWGQWNADENFKAVISPTIKGYTASEKVITSQNVNPESKDLVFNVYYAKNEQTNGTVLLQDDDVITETIKYVYADSGLPAAPTYKDAIGFTREGISNGKTTTWKTWNPENGTFKAVTSPDIAGYTVSEKIVKAIVVKPGDKDIEILIYYTPIPAPTVTPEPSPESEPTPQPHPQSEQIPIPDPVPVSDVPQPHAAMPLDNTSEENDHSITNISNLKHADIVVARSLANEHEVQSTNQRVKSKLPQTGTQKGYLAQLGLSISLIAGLLSLVGLRKKKN